MVGVGDNSSNIWTVTAVDTNLIKYCKGVRLSREEQTMYHVQMMMPISFVVLTLAEVNNYSSL